MNESKERVTVALHSLGHQINDVRTIVNLTPSEQKKNGPIFDLPMAIGILKSIGVITSNIPASSCFIGALSLDGSILPFDGLLAAVLTANKLGFKRVYMPFDASLPKISMEGLEIVYVSSLHDVIQHLSGQMLLPFHILPESDHSIYQFSKDCSDIIGHDLAKRALEIAAAGEHHVFRQVHQEGCGKSLLAETFPSI